MWVGMERDACRLFILFICLFSPSLFSFSRLFVFHVVGGDDDADDDNDDDLACSIVRHPSPFLPSFILSLLVPT